jgi:hypothetical protein
MQWGIGVGATAITLLTADSLTAGTRAGRRLPLGIQTFPIGSLVGAQAQTVTSIFTSPLIIEPGTYCQIILKMPLASATASQLYRGVCQINGYFE